MKFTYPTCAELKPGDVVFRDGQKTVVETVELVEATAHGRPYYLVNGQKVGFFHEWTRWSNDARPVNRKENKL